MSTNIASSQNYNDDKQSRRITTVRTITHFQSNFLPLMSKIVLIITFSILGKLRIKIIGITVLLPTVIAWGVIVPSVFFNFKKTDFHVLLIDVSAR